MRSKEVENAIKVMQRDITDYKEELEIELEDRIDEQHISYLIQQTTSYETVLSYIEELEEETKEIEFDLTSVYMSGFYDGEKKYKDKIRDKIKELDKNELLGKMNFEQVKFATDILKSIIGE